MRDIFLVFDYLGPNGYIPFIHKKTEIGKIFDKSLRTIEQASYFPNNQKALTSELIRNKTNFKENISIVVIDEFLKDVELTEIISDELKLLLDSHDNFNLIYFNHNASMRTLT